MNQKASCKRCEKLGFKTKTGMYNCYALKGSKTTLKSMCGAFKAKTKKKPKSQW